MLKIKLALLNIVLIDLNLFFFVGFTSDIDVQAELFSTLGKLVVRNEFCKEVMDWGGLDLIMSSFQTNIAQKVSLLLVIMWSFEQHVGFLVSYFVIVIL